MRGDTIWHEAGHVAAARLLGLEVVEVKILDPILDDGGIAVVRVDPGDAPPIDIAVMTYMPALVIMCDWKTDPRFGRDRENLERGRPSHWPSDVWAHHVHEEAKKLHQGEGWRTALWEAVQEVEAACERAGRRPVEVFGG